MALNHFFSRTVSIIGKMKHSVNVKYQRNVVMHSIYMVYLQLWFVRMFKFTVEERNQCELPGHVRLYGFTSSCQKRVIIP